MTMTPLIRRFTRLLTAHIDGPLLMRDAAADGSRPDRHLQRLEPEHLARIERSRQHAGRARRSCTCSRTFRRISSCGIALPLYVLGVLLLVCVALFGDSRQRRAALAAHRRHAHTALGDHENRGAADARVVFRSLSKQRSSSKNYIIAALLLIVPVGLIVRQPDLGTALLISAAGAYVLFLAGLSGASSSALATAGAACMPFVWSVHARLSAPAHPDALDPTQDPLGAGYHTIQSTIALVPAACSARAGCRARQTHLDFIPERTTDFIFAVFSEEFGLIGNSLLLVLFLLVIARGVVITANAPTLFTRLFGGAITLTFFTYAFVNMGMVSGILPVVGVPLPLMSYGGTSLVTVCLGLGILMSIQTHKKLVQS